ncbi:unnamed protein product, partial [Callosobruchus maculatus]
KSDGHSRGVGNYVVYCVGNSLVFRYQHTYFPSNPIFFNMDENQNIEVIEEVLSQPRKRSVYLESAAPFYQNKDANPISKVAPANVPNVPIRAFQEQKNVDSVLYESLTPMLMLMKVIGIFPITQRGPTFIVTPKLMIYSVVLFILICGYVGYIKWDKVEMVRSAEGRFEEAVIDYLFSIYLVPIVINILSWYEARKHARVLTSIMAFEKVYFKVTKKRFKRFLRNKPLIVTIGLLILATANMTVTHVTMVHFKLLQIIPFCYINIITYILGGIWYLYCNLIGETATIIATDFALALRNIGPASQVANYRSLWMMLSKITRDVGNAFGCAMTFLCLYLFLIITLTIYGLLSQIQEGFGIKDIGLAITALFAGAMLFFISNEAHYASNCVRVQFQKKLLLVELTWMTEDAQQEVISYCTVPRSPVAKARLLG